MRREQFEHVIAAAAEVAGEREIVVIGSQAILGNVDEPPASMLFELLRRVDDLPEPPADRAHVRKMLEGVVARVGRGVQPGSGPV